MLVQFQLLATSAPLSRCQTSTEKDFTKILQPYRNDKSIWTDLFGTPQPPKENLPNILLN